VYQRGSLVNGLAMYLSCDTKKFHDNESTHILHNFWTSTHRGELPPWRRHCLEQFVCCAAVDALAALHKLQVVGIAEAGGDEQIRAERTRGHTHCASVHQAAKLAAALLRVAGVTAGLAESNGSVPSGL